MWSHGAKYEKQTEIILRVNTGIVYERYVQLQVIIILKHGREEYTYMNRGHIENESSK